jgi:hypothetical protein
MILHLLARGSFARLPRALGSAAGLALAAWCAGCAAPGAASAPASAPAVVFPSRDDLARIPSREPRAEAFGKDDVAVEVWSFESAVAIDGASYEDGSAWGDVARELAKGHEATTTLSPALRCAAEELARFHLKNGGMPTESLRRFMAARCGAVTTGMVPVLWSATMSGPVSDAEIASKVSGGFAKRLAERLGAGHHLLGVGAARDAQHVTAVAVVAADEARLEGTTLAVDASRRVVLRGAARGDFAEIGAMINRGDTGVAPCEADPSVRPPRFALTCELAQGDSFAWVEILGRRAKQLLVHELAEAIVHDGDRNAIAYSGRHVGPPAPVTGAADFTHELLDRLNRVRSAAQLASLALAPKQSAENARLAGTLIDASLGEDDATANQAAIGLLAGWDVPGLVRNGNFFLGVVGPTNDAAAWLDFALERPIGRSALLDPAARQIAVGAALPPGGGALGAAVTTYAMFGSEDHAAEATSFFQRVAAARASRGLPAPVRVQGLGEMDVELARVMREGAAPMAALDATMQLAVERTGQGVRGYVLETNDVEHAEVPEALLRPGRLSIVVGVTHHRVEGAAWGQYVVMVIVLGGGTTA